jgi:alkanesulfonate monooxygenase SsuD/methylene tetrahydromethanopterin reductase-like flavin-dependent oxidoreductase (luciferase family)
VGRDYDTIVKTYICDCVALAPTLQQATSLRQASLFSPYQPMVGTPDELADQIESYADLGFSHFMLRFADYPRTDGVKMFIREVLPRFK